MLVAFYYGKGVANYQQYEKLDGDYVTQFVSRKYRQMFGKSGKEPPRLFVHNKVRFCTVQRHEKLLEKLGEYYLLFLSVVRI